MPTSTPARSTRVALAAAALLATAALAGERDDGDARDGAAPTELLLVPDSGLDQIWALDAFDGSVVDPAFIPNDGRLLQPINAVPDGFGSILISDESADAVFEYGTDGTFIRVIADASDGIDGAWGLAVEGCGALLCSRTAGSLTRIDLITLEVEVLVEAMGSPRDAAFRMTDVLVTDSATDDILRYSKDGLFLGVWHASNGIDGIDFPHQLEIRPGERAIAAGFSTPRGIYAFDRFGDETGRLSPTLTGARGVVTLGNGRILYSGGTRLVSIDPVTGDEEVIVNSTGSSFRFIERFDPDPGPRGDLNRDGRVNGADLTILLSEWGDCGFCGGDLTCDGAVDGLDIGILVSQWTG